LKPETGKVPGSSKVPGVMEPLNIDLELLTEEVPRFHYFS
jgi:hypothetical protein